MNPEIFRLLIAAAIIALGFGSYRLVNLAILRRANHGQPGLETLRPNTPAVLYFTTPYCAPCRTFQRPALARLIELTGERVQIIQVDALEQPKLAESWGVLSVPTTFVIDSSGRARRINHGVASAEKLLGQLEEVEGNSLLAGPASSSSASHAHVPGTD